MKRTALTPKLIVLGVDGMDPRVTRKFIAEGIMPNMKKFIEKGSAREDLSHLVANYYATLLDDTCYRCLSRNPRYYLLLAPVTQEPGCGCI